MTAWLRVTGILAVLLATGCGGAKCHVRGTVTQDGEPLQWKTDGGFLLVIFIPEPRKPSSSVYRAETERDTGAFEVSKIPTGNYRVAIQQFDEKHNDALGHVYNPGATELMREVTGDGQVIDIDLPQNLPRAGKAGPEGDRPRRKGS